MKQKYLIVIAFLIVITVATLALQVPEYKSLIKSINKTDKKIKAVNDKLISARVLTQDKEEVSKVIANSVSDKFYVGDNEINFFVTRLASIADKYKIPVTKIIPRSFEKASKYKLTQRYTVGINATYVQLGQFLSSIESLDYLVHIDEIVVTPLPLLKGNENSDTRYQTTMQVTTVKLIKES